MGDCRPLESSEASESEWTRLDCGRNQKIQTVCHRQTRGSSRVL